MDFTPEFSVTQDQSWVSNVTTVTVSVASITKASNSSAQYTGLTIFNDIGVNNGGNYTVSGIIVDSGDQSVADVALTTTFYSSNGTVVGLSLTDLGTAMTPGQAIPFAISPWDNTATLSNEIANYTILVQIYPHNSDGDPRTNNSTDNATYHFHKWLSKPHTNPHHDGPQ